MDESDYHSQGLDHLGIVAGICDQIGLVEEIDLAVEPTGRKVTVGQAVKAMVLNGLGFVSRPLYLTPEFYANKPVDLLIGPGIEAADLNDDSLGRAMDHLFRAGTTEVFARVAVRALRVFAIETRFSHLDTTAFSVKGEYKQEADATEEEPVAIKLTYGYSKDHRPDLKQAVLALICANESSIPVWLAALSGNEADKASFPRLAADYLAQFGKDEETPYLVADSALYAADTLSVLSEVKWVTRVPATLTEAKTFLAETPADVMIPAERSGYSYYEKVVTYADIEQRWLLVVYEATREQAMATLARAVAKEEEAAQKALNKLARQDYACEQDARLALDRLPQSWKFHKLEAQAEPLTRYAHPGRPGPDTPTSTAWYVSGNVLLDEQKVEEARLPLGRYIIATNELDSTRLPTLELLTIYKDQNRSVERGFRFLKDPLFFAGTFYIKKPERFMALLMVMGLCLLVYALAEHVLRARLVEFNETVPDQKGKPTQRITLRRVFQMFEGIDLLLIDGRQSGKRRVLNLTDLHRRILRLLGPPTEHCYLIQ